MFLAASKETRVEVFQLLKRGRGESQHLNGWQNSAYFPVLFHVEIFKWVDPEKSVHSQRKPELLGDNWKMWGASSTEDGVWASFTGSKIGYVSWYLGYVSVICPLDCCILACNQLEERPGRKAGEQGVGPRTLQCVTIRILRTQCRKEGTFIFLLEKACAPVGNTQVLYGQTDLGLTAIPYMPVMRPCLVSESYFPHLYSKDFCQD